MNQGCDFEFETSNYHIKTTAQREWSIVVHNEPLTPSEAGHDRRIPALDELELLPMSTKANLCRAEIIALVLYTGPMVNFCVLVWCFVLLRTNFLVLVQFYGLQRNFKAIPASCL